MCSTFCGDFGDATWGTLDDPNSCAAKTGYDKCYKYVAEKPGDFTAATWEVKSLKVYQLKDKPVTTTTTTTTVGYLYGSQGLIADRKLQTTTTTTTTTTATTTTSTTVSRD